MKLLKLFIVLVFLLFLTACLSSSSDDSDSPDNGGENGDNGDDNGDDGDNGDDSGDGIGGGDAEIITSLDSRSGLSNHADNHDLLYFLSTVEGNRGLFAVDPEWASDPAVRVDDDIPDLLFDNPDATYFPLHQMDWNPDEGVVENYRIDTVFYLPRIESTRRVGVEGPAEEVNPIEVAANPHPYAAMNFRIANDVTDVSNTAFAWPENEGWYRVYAHAEEGEADFFGEDIQVQIALADVQAGRGDGWLVVDEADDNTLWRFDNDLNPVGKVAGPDGEPVEGVAVVSGFGGDYADGSRYVIIGFESEEDGWASGELWRYQGDGSDQPGELAPVENDDGDRLSFPPAFSFTQPFLVPSAAGIANLADGTYFVSRQALGTPSLFQLQGNEWEVIRQRGSHASAMPKLLIRAGERLVWAAEDDAVMGVESLLPDGSDIITLADGISISEEAVTSPVSVSAGDWVFFNVGEQDADTGEYDYTAVAASVDGETRVELDDARWRGVSTTGAGFVPGSLLEGLTPSSVFLSTANDELAAVDASDPLAGQVILGELPAGAEARFQGLAPGPHRLVWVVQDGSPPSSEVYYIDVREAGSLQPVSIQPDGSDRQRPLPRF